MRYTPSKAYSQYGASMGRPRTALDGSSRRKCRLFRLPLDSGGYDQGGAYWGTPDNLFVLMDDDMDAIAYVRASSRKDAYDQLIDQYTFTLARRV